MRLGDVHPWCGVTQLRRADSEWLRCPDLLLTGGRGGLICRENKGARKYKRHAEAGGDDAERE